MNIQVKHNNVDITQYVVEYTREQKICSGIGTLNLVVTSEYATTINTWDSFILYEEGIQTGVYYVNVVSDVQPDGKITVYCQDGTKYLNDFFIADNYEIDYYTETGEWIDKFLSDAGVTSRDVPAGGEPISNNTTLGMMSAYEQIVTLLQMSGWYMHFENETCIVGDLLVAANGVVDSLDTTDILTIKLIKNDKLLRNRALVLGSGNANGGWITADISKVTNYNYDANDLRAAVVSNGAIASKAKAKEIAAKMLAAFGDITIEKHIQVHGGRNIRIGDFVYVESSTWSGVGLVTTIGSTMGRDGFITNITLDEKCPRLFTCFNPEEIIYAYGFNFVYVSTTTGGVFRKRVEEDPYWYPFSSGLSSLNIVDLYANQGILSCIDSNGVAYRATEVEGLWRPITLSGLEYSSTFTDIVDATYSGDVRARAIIQDRHNNHIKIAADNRIGEVKWDYFNWGSEVDTPSLGIHNLGWIVDVNPQNGNIVNNYPVIPSGYSNLQVLDIENDGLNDYISIKDTSGSGEPAIGYGSDSTLFNVIPNSADTTAHFLTETYDSSGFTPTSDEEIIYHVDGDTLTLAYNNVTYGDTEQHFYFRTHQVSGGVLSGTPTTDLEILTEYQNWDVYFLTFLAITKVDTSYKLFYIVYDLTGSSIECATIVPGVSYSIDFIADDTTENFIPSRFTKTEVADIWAVLIDTTNIEIHSQRLNLENYTFVGDTVEYTYAAGSSYLNYNFASFQVNDNNSWLLTLLELENDVLPGVGYKDGHVKSIYNGSTLLSHYVPRISIFDLDTYFGNIHAYLYNKKDTLIKYPTEQTIGLSVKSIVSFYSGDNTAVVEDWYDLTYPPYSEKYTALKSFGTDTVFPHIVQSSVDFHYYSLGDPKDFGSAVDITPSINSGNVVAVLGATDIDGSVLFLYRNPGNTWMKLVGESITGSETKLATINYSGSTWSNARLMSHFLFLYNVPNTSVYYINAPVSAGGGGISYKVLQRDDVTFSGIHTGTTPDRLDISHQIPIVIMGNGLYETSIAESHLGDVTVVDLPISSGNLIGDYRYYQEIDVVSGLIHKYLIYTSSDGVSIRPIYDGGTVGDAVVLFATPSLAVQVETSTYIYSNQYKFVSVSGSFFQYSPFYPSGWLEYNIGLPENCMITRIRVDDRF